MEKTPMICISQVFKHSCEKQIHSSDQQSADIQMESAVLMEKMYRFQKGKKIRNHCFYSEKMNELQNMFLRIQE